MAQDDGIVWRLRTQSEKACADNPAKAAQLGWEAADRIEALEEGLRAAPSPDHVMGVATDNAYASWFDGERRALLNHKD